MVVAFRRAKERRMSGTNAEPSSECQDSDFDSPDKKRVAGLLATVGPRPDRLRRVLRRLLDEIDKATSSCLIDLCVQL